VAKTIQTEASSEPGLDFVEDTLTFHLRWNPEKLRQGLLAAYGREIFNSFAPRIQEELRLPVATVLLNKRYAWMTMPTLLYSLRKVLKMSRVA
jgi:hypothetical protein